MKSYTISITLSIDADSESEACGEAVSIMRSQTTTGIYDMMEVTLDHEDLVLTNDATRHWLEQLPDGYRELALANYGKRKTKSTHDADSVSVALFVAFEWDKTPEKFGFWDAVYISYLRTGEPLPPLP